MPNKILTIGAAVGVSALVLLLTVIVGGPGAGGRDETPTVPENPDIFIGGAPGGELPIGEAGPSGYEFWENDRRTRVNWTRLIPLPDGVADLVDPVAHISLGPGRELTIRGDEATVVAPDNHPREGQMRGHVVVTLYETPDGSPVRFTSDRDVVLRSYFDEPVQFDLELQQIDSEGPIFMTGPQVQFLGQGLSLNYNQLRHRIERLVIERGESLHYIPNPATATKGKGSTRPARSQHGKRSKPTAATKQSDDTAGTQPDTATAGSTSADPARPVQFYLATFEQLQDVRVGQDQYVIEGDDLSAVFSTKAAGELDEQDQPTPGGIPTTPAPPDSSDPAVDTTMLPLMISGRSIELASSDPLRGALLNALAASIGQVPAKVGSADDPRSLATFTDEDVVITWSGRLVISPLSDVPDKLAGPDDVMVSVRGSRGNRGTPARIRTDHGETVSAPKVSFFSQNARLLTEGTPESPVRVDAPDMGTLTGQELSIDQLHGTGYVLGPGKLTGLVKQKDTPTGGSDLSADTRSQIPDTPTPNTQPITVAFNDRLDLEFYLKDKSGQSPSDPGNPAGNSRIKGVKTATFTGNVAVDYTELDMTADRLTLALLEDAPKGEDKLAVGSLDAHGNIHADVKDQDVKIQADRLHAEPANDKLELFGTPGYPAQVIRPDATLAGGDIVMDQRARTVNVVGPGWFDFLQDPDDPGKTIRVTWAGGMQYDDAGGTAHFLGDVKTLSTDGTDTHELMGDDLQMTFVKNDSADDIKADEIRGDRTGGRRLATAAMTGHVRFRARSYATPNRKRMLTELFMMGPLMTFNDPGPRGAGSMSNDTRQLVQVIGTGRMLITDTRPAPNAQVSRKRNRSGKQAPIDMAGRGKTAFQWSVRLVLNLTDGLMTMKGAVAMVHQPPDGDRVQMDCQNLSAELKAASGRKGAKTSGDGGNFGGGWLAKDAPKPELDRVWADDGIRIIQGPYTIHCDHLLYQEAKRDILLWSDDPRQVTYEVQGEPNVTQSSALKWHRDTGRIEVFKIRTGTIPLRKDQQETKN